VSGRAAQSLAADHQRLLGRPPQDAGIRALDAGSRARSVLGGVGQKSAAAVKGRGPAPKLQQQMERIQRLPKAEQPFVMEMIDTVLFQQHR
jgi:hypothetical protein